MAMTLRTDDELEKALTALAAAEGTSRQEVGHVTRVYARPDDRRTRGPGRVARHSRHAAGASRPALQRRART